MTAKHIKITDALSAEFNIAVGGKIEIELPQSGNILYQWHFDITEGDDRVKEAGIQSSRMPIAGGSGSIRAFYDAVDTGEVVIRAREKAGDKTVDTRLYRFRIV